MTAAVALGAAGSAPAATKWLCGPGVAHDPCRPSLSTTRYHGWDVRAGRFTPTRGPRPRRRLLLRVPDGLRPADAGSRPSASTRRSARSRSTRPRGSRRSAASTRPCTARRPSRRCRPGRRRRRDYLTAYGDVEQAFDAFLRRIGPAPRLRPARPLAGQLPPGAARPPAHRRPRRAAPPDGVGGAARRRRHRPQGIGPRRHVPAGAHLRAGHPALLRDRLQHVQRDAAGPVGLRPRRPLALPRAADGKLETACTNPAALGSNRSAPLQTVGADGAVRPRHADRGRDLAAGDPVADRADDVRAERRRVHRPLLARGRRSRAADRLGAGDAGSRRHPRRRSGACTSSTPTSPRATS